MQKDKGKAPSSSNNFIP